MLPQQHGPISEFPFFILHRKLDPALFYFGGSEGILGGSLDGNVGASLDGNSGASLDGILGASLDGNSGAGELGPMSLAITSPSFSAFLFAAHRAFIRKPAAFFCAALHFRFFGAGSGAGDVSFVDVTQSGTLLSDFGGRRRRFLGDAPEVKRSMADCASHVKKNTACTQFNRLFVE
jgi:hypothetical protein